MSPIGPRHVAIVNRLNALLSRQVGDQAIVSVQNPIQLTDYTELQPDIALLRPRADFYARALPLPDDVLLVVEVAETSLEYDRDEKIPHYARAAIPEVWLIDAQGGTVTQYAQPGGTAYGHEQTLARGQRLVSQTLHGLHTSVDEVLP